MQRFFTIFFIFAIALCGMTMPAFGQIYGPEGLNMPGAYDSFNNPPTINAFGGIEKTGGTFLVDNTLGTQRYKTLVHALSSGGDVVGGTAYDFLFTSGPSSGYFNNKWANTVVSMNTEQSYTYLTSGGTNDNVTFTNGMYYTIVWQDNGYNNNNATFMATSAVPVTIPTVTQFPAAAHVGTGAVTVNVTTSSAPAPEEIVYVRYSTDGWVTSALAQASFSGANGTATIPAQVAGTTVSYYVFSTTVSSPSTDFDVQTINSNNNSKNNYSYTTEAHLFVATNSAQLGSVVWNPAGTPGGSDTAIIPDGILDTINTNDSLASLIIGGGTSGLLQFDGVAARLFSVGNITINAGGQFIGRLNKFAGFDSLNVYGDLTNNGTFDMFPGGNTGTLSNANETVTTFRKVGNQNVQTTGTPLLTRFGKVNFNKGSQANKVEATIDVRIGQGTHAPDVGSFISTTVVSSLWLSGVVKVNQLGTWEQSAGTFYVYSTTFSPNINGAFNLIGSANIYDSTG
ncbi:MAG TPA: hypothetical protein VKI62_03170, partial [Bacteroidota bacterium]|nr:hypothetical protein [Bacteroidota bacterium]